MKSQILRAWDVALHAGLRCPLFFSVCGLLLSLWCLQLVAFTAIRARRVTPALVSEHSQPFNGVRSDAGHLELLRSVPSGYTPREPSWQDQHNTHAWSLGTIIVLPTTTVYVVDHRSRHVVAEADVPIEYLDDQSVVLLDDGSFFSILRRGGNAVLYDSSDLGGTNLLTKLERRFINFGVTKRCQCVPWGKFYYLEWGAPYVLAANAFGSVRVSHVKEGQTAMRVRNEGFILFCFFAGLIEMLCYYRHKLQCTARQAAFVWATMFFCFVLHALFWVSMS